MPVPDAQAQIQTLQAQVNNLQQQAVAANGHGSRGYQAGSPATVPRRWTKRSWRMCLALSKAPG